MAFLPKLLAASVVIALAVAGPAEARRFGDGTSIGARAPETTPAPSVKTPTPLPRMETTAGNGTRPFSSVDTRNAVIAGVAAGAVSAAARNARADARENQDAAGQAQAASPPLNSIALTEARLQKMDALAERQRSAAAATPPGAVGVTPEEKPVVKTAAERRAEQKEAEQKAARDKIDEEKRIQLARVTSCRVEPVMTDAAIATCRRVMR